MLVAGDPSCQFVLTAVPCRAISHPVTDPPSHASTDNAEATSMSQPFAVRQLAGRNPRDRRQIGLPTATSRQTIRSRPDRHRGFTRRLVGWRDFRPGRWCGTHRQRMSTAVVPIRDGDTRARRALRQRAHAHTPHDDDRAMIPPQGRAPLMYPNGPERTPVHLYNFDRESAEHRPRVLPMRNLS